MDKRNVSALEVARKVLHRRRVDELFDGMLLDEAIDTALQPPNGTSDADLLAFYVTLLRQLTAVVTASENGGVQNVVDLVHRRLSPMLQANGALSTLLLSSFANTSKPYPVRAAECLTAATKLAAALPAPATSSSRPYFLSAFFDQILRDGLGTRSNLVALGIMIDTIPAINIPDNLLDRLLQDVCVSDCCNVRCGTIASLLIRQKREASGIEAERDRAMFGHILRVIENDPDATEIMSRYLFPPLFKAERSSFSALLDLLDQAGGGHFAAWITTACFGVSNGIIGLEGLPRERVMEAITHQDNRLRIKAFELVALSKSVLQPEAMELVKQSFHWNTVIPHPDGRTDMASAIYAFLQNLKAVEHATERDEKRAKTDELAAQLRICLDVAAAFHIWFVEDFITPSIRQCREMPALRAIFALKLTRLYLDIFGDRQVVVEHVFTPGRVTILIACQASEFAEMRSQARAIVSRAPSPLPGYEALESPSTQQLLASATASINHPRKTQAEAGRATLCIIFTKLVLPAGPGNAIAFVNSLIDLLDQHMIASEKNLAKGIVEFPLHGLLCAITEVVKTLDLQEAAVQTAWSPVLHRLATLVQRVWAVTRPVISLGPSDGSDTAAHEIARAYEVLGEGDEEGDDQDHTNLLSGCWRAMGQAAELLAVIIALPLSHDQSIWTKDEIRRAGFSFLTWLHEIRHRGTFSRIAPALASVREAVKHRAELCDLVSEWLDNELNAVAEGQLSTLRRSAGLPYSILALVAGDQRLLDHTITVLNAMADVKAATSDETKVHAMNTLRTVLVDAKQTRLLPRYLESSIMVSLAAFASSNWNVRNVGLLLLSTLADRSMSTARSLEDFSSRAALVARPTLASWHAKYPSIIPYITDYLRSARRQGPASLTQHSPLFPILIILRSLRWSPAGEALADSLFPVVEPYLGSVEWQVREVASQVLSSLLSPARALEKAKITATRVSHSSEDLNTLHGRLLFLRRLFTDVIEWPETDNSDRRILEMRLRDALAIAPQTPVIPKAILDCIVAYLDLATPTSAKLLQTAVLTSKSFLTTRRGPGADLLHVVAAQIILLDRRNGLDYLLSSSMSEDVQLIALDSLNKEQTSPAHLKVVLKMCQGSDSVRTKAYEAIASWPISEPSIAAMFSTFLRDTESRCVPLREAALVAAGKACCDRSEAEIGALAERVFAAASEDEAEPSRASALECLSHLGVLLFSAPPLGASWLLHRALLALLEDDDVDLRARAADVVARGLGLPRPVVPEYALQLWWDWMSKQDLGDEHISWLWDLIFKEPTRTAIDVLFVEEPPNMWRNPLTSANYAARILANLKASPAAPPPSPSTSAASSPIDAGWAEAEIRRRRLEAYNIALGY